MVHRSGMAASQNIARVRVSDLHCEGFNGWWQPLDVLLGRFMLDGNVVSLATTSPWDGVLGGRLDPIIQMTRNVDKARVRSFFGDCTTLRCVVGECLANNGRVRRDGFPYPMVLVSRFRDNLYLLVCGVCLTLFPRLRCAIASLLNVVYRIKLKWEPEGMSVVWGVATVTVGR